MEGVGVGCLLFCYKPELKCFEVVLDMNVTDGQTRPSFRYAIS